MLCRLLLFLFLVGSTANATTSATVTATITVFSSITFLPTSLAFGTQQIGQSVTKAFTVTNGGTAAFNFNVSLAPNNSLFSVSNSCGGSLAVNASCQISVTFSPTVAATENARVDVSGSGRTYSGFVSGVGSNAPAPPTPTSIALSPASIQIQDNAAGGSIVSRATVTMSDGSTAASCTLSTSNSAYYQVSGMNIVLAHGLSSADDGQHNTDIAVVSCP